MTTKPLIYPRIDWETSSDAAPYSDGRSYPWSDACGPVPREVQPDGRSLPICDPGYALLGNPGTYSEREDWSLHAVQLLPDGRFQADSSILATDRDGSATPADRLVMAYDLTVPFLLAAVDPVAEEQLVGLDDAVVNGRAVRTDDTVAVNRRGAVDNHKIPRSSSPIGPSSTSRWRPGSPGSRSAPQGWRRSTWRRR